MNYIHICNTQMRECGRVQGGSDGVCWWCTSCKIMRSIHINSFFSKSRLTLRQWFLLMVWWAREYPVCAAAVKTEVTEATTCQVYKWCQDVCSTMLLQTPTIKVKLKHMKGCHFQNLPGYLDEFMWRKINGKTGKEASTTNNLTHNHFT